MLASIASLALLLAGASWIGGARLEKRHRAAWAVLSQQPVRVHAGPYRGTDIVPAQLDRAPRLVRVAARACFSGSWLCMSIWVAVGVVGPERTPFGPAILAGIAVGACLARAATRLLRRDPGVVAFGRRVAVAAAVHTLLVLLLTWKAGAGAWAGPAAVLALVSLLPAALLVVAVRRKASLLARPRDEEPLPRALPVWLARALERRIRRRTGRAASCANVAPLVTRGTRDAAEARQPASPAVVLRVAHAVPVPERQDDSSAGRSAPRELLDEGLADEPGGVAAHVPAVAGNLAHE